MFDVRPTRRVREVLDMALQHRVGLDANGVQDLFAFEVLVHLRHCDGLAKKIGERVTLIQIRAGIDQPIIGHGRETEPFVEFAVGEQTAIARQPRAVEFQKYAWVEIDS